MKKTLNKFARLTLLDYKLPMSLVDDCFITKTEEIIKTLEKDKMCYNFSLTMRQKDKKNSNYAELYHKKIEEIKKKLLNTINGSILKNCLAYNNRFLFLRLSELPLIKDKQKINNFFKSINAYLNRMAFNPTYGGLMGFYSRISLKKNCLKTNRLSLKILEQPNGLMQKNVNSKIVCFNPTIFSKKNKILFFRFKDDFEEIVKINNFSNITLAKEIKKTKGLQGLLDIDLASNSHFDIYKNCFGASSRPTRHDLVEKNNFKIKEGFVYDVINTDTITVHKRVDDNFKLAASTCLNYLKKQLSDLHNEKKMLGKILADHLRDIGSGSCLLLDFIASFKRKIEEIRDNRDNFGSYFENKISSLILTNANDQVVVKRRLKINNMINKLEFYFSTCQINNKEIYIFENISPIGILSSRQDYFLKNEPSRDISTNKTAEPLEIVFCPVNPKMYHAYRRNKKHRYFLNVNQFTERRARYQIDANEMELVLSKDLCPMLYCRRLDRMFDPVFNSTLSAKSSIILIFLRMISHSQEEVSELPNFLPKNISALVNIPRLIVNNVVVLKRKWCFNSTELNIIKKSVPDVDEFLLILNKLLERNIPRFVNLVRRGENPKTIDIYNPFSLLQIKKYQNDRCICFEELLPYPGQYSGSCGSENDYLIQYLF